MTTLDDLFAPADLKAEIDVGYIARKQHPELPLSIYTYGRTCQYENGYMPLTLRDVLPSRETETQAASSATILNSPRWMPRPLGQQFAEMSRSRQRSIVEAAIELTAQLGGEAEGWPLKRAMATVMPHVEAV